MFQASQVVLVVKSLPTNSGGIRDAVSIPGWGGSPGGAYGNPLQYFLPRESHGQRNLTGYSPYSCTESDMTKAT